MVKTSFWNAPHSKTKNKRDVYAVYSLCPLKEKVRKEKSKQAKLKISKFVCQPDFRTASAGLKDGWARSLAQATLSSVPLCHKQKRWTDEIYLATHNLIHYQKRKCKQSKSFQPFKISKHRAMKNEISRCYFSNIL